MIMIIKVKVIITLAVTQQLSNARHHSDHFICIKAFNLITL